MPSLANLRYPSQDGLAFTGKWEGWRSRWYRDIGGVWTRGFGHAKTAADIVDSSELAPAEGYALLLSDMARCVAPLVVVAEKFEWFHKQNRVDGFADWLFNCGPGALGTEGNPSHALEGAMRNDTEMVVAGLRLWCMVTVDGAKVRNQGLLNRRISEGALCVSPLVRIDPEPTERGLVIAVPDEEIARRGEVILWDLVGAAEDDDRAADLARRNREAGF